MFPHKDVDAARTMLRGAAGAASASCSSPTACSAWTATSAPLPELCALAEEFGCIMMVDDAHASGVFGRNGRGTIDHFGMHGRVDIQVGTLSKAIGALGGYVAGSRDARSSSCYHRARPFLFSTSHPPAVAAACIAALDVLLEEPQIIERLWENTRFFKAGLQALGFNTGLEREPDHAGDRRRRRAGDEAVGSAVRGGRVRAGHRVPDRARATRRACARSSRPRTRARSCSSRSTRSRKVGRELGIDASEARRAALRGLLRRPTRAI